MAASKTGLAADRPTRSPRGFRYIAEDTNQEWVSDGVDWIETTGSAGGGGGGGSSDVVAIMRHGDPVQWNHSSYQQIGPTVPVVGDNTRWAKVEVHIPEFSLTLDESIQGPAGQQHIQASVAIASEDQTIFYQDDYFMFETPHDSVGGVGMKADPTLIALIPPWSGTIDLAIIVWVSPNVPSRIGAQDIPGYSQQVEMLVTMFDAPATIL